MINVYIYIYIYIQPVIKLVSITFLTSLLFVAELPVEDASRWDNFTDYALAPINKAQTVEPVSHNRSTTMSRRGNARPLLHLHGRVDSRLHTLQCHIRCVVKRVDPTTAPLIQEWRRMLCPRPLIGLEKKRGGFTNPELPARGTS